MQKFNLILFVSLFFKIVNSKYLNFMRLKKLKNWTTEKGSKQIKMINN